MGKALRVRVPPRATKLLVYRPSKSIPDLDVFVGSGARLTLFIPILPTTQNTVVQVFLDGKQATAEIYGAGVLTGQQALTLRTDTIHRAPYTSANTIVKAVVTDAARFEFEGMIKIQRIAQHSKDFLRQDSLLLSDSAVANSIPALEIEAHEVQASHSATAAPVDSEQLFYLQSRGISSRLAMELVTKAFLEQALKYAPSAARRAVLNCLSRSQSGAKAGQSL